MNEGVACGGWPTVGHAGAFQTKGIWGKEELVPGTGDGVGWTCALRSVSMVVDEGPGPGPKNGVGVFCRLNAMVRNCAIDNALTHTFFLLEAEELEGTAFADFFRVTLGMQLKKK